MKEAASQQLFAQTFNAIGNYYRSENRQQDERQTAAWAALAEIDEYRLDPVLSRTTATGAFLRDKLEPVVSPVMEQLRCLQDKIQ